jgi:chromosomal replication initiation ATPase DnaA
MVVQQRLPFPDGLAYDPADFLPGESNAEALAWLERPSAWPGLRLAVHGEAGVGKTHFLHVLAARTGAALLPAAGIRGFVELPDVAAIGIDEADRVAEAVGLLHVLNAAAERGTPVLLAARTAPARWGFGLPDLVSRLRATTAVELLAPEDGLLRALLARLLADRQMRVPARWQDYLLARLPRTGGALRAAVVLLDAASMEAGGGINSAVVQRVVTACGGSDAADIPQ